MFKNRLVTIMLIILVALTLIGGLTLFLYTQFFQAPEDPNAAPTIEEVIERSVETEEITTNLASNQIIRGKFVIEADSVDARNELELRAFQIENIIISKLADLTAQDFQGSEGITALEASIANEINLIMQEGQVTRVYMQQKIIQ
ncbi:flagellar basal body-associated protein FliL [Paenalkalicoccus suaedae]|uniref:Flagellar protein FliL n=1 Tax=Paenalkalicoccus suaedae TaxID=2592382 RepID=A0A859FEY7_9BACI|nr:flagellar basal body-associated protein FliL [Paenalkalicoccus suaedae]QKS71430.1 flagellar basal body-associated protein FliL [Paenalkalicoccus suaedae]